MYSNVIEWLNYTLIFLLSLICKTLGDLFEEYKKSIVKRHMWNSITVVSIESLCEHY